MDAFVVVNRSHSKIVGLTGGVASGKSTVAKLLAERDVYVVDVDDISRALSAPGGLAIPAIRSMFPEVFAGDVLMREKLRAIVFADVDKRRKLEAILHPLIRSESQRALKSEAALRAPYCVLVVPLLFESDGYRGQIDCAVVVDVPRSVQIERMQRTRGLSEQIANQIVAAQLPREARLARTQFVIENSQGLDETEIAVNRLHQVFLANYRSDALSQTSEYATEVAL